MYLKLPLFKKHKTSVKKTKINKFTKIFTNRFHKILYSLSKSSEKDVENFKKY